MKVFRGVRRNVKMHFDKDCLIKFQKAGHREVVVIEVELTPEVNGVFCKWCSPPELRTQKVLHSRCAICRHPRPMPCQHNGGVAVMVWSKRWQHYERRYRWPENVRGSTIADPEK